jgi:hypothetical protein
MLRTTALIISIDSSGSRRKTKTKVTSNGIMTILKFLVSQPPRFTIGTAVAVVATEMEVATAAAIAGIIVGTTTTRVGMHLDSAALLEGCRENQ